MMPNHFHWQFYVREIVLQRKILWEHSDKIEYERRRKKIGEKAMPVERTTHRTADENGLISLNHAIGTLQKSYTDALNKEKNWSGSIFRKKCKAKDGWIDEFVTV